MVAPWLFITGLLRRPHQTETILDGAPILLSQATGIPGFRRALPHLGQELARARRYRRVLSVVVLSLAGDRIAERPVRSGDNGSNRGDHPAAPYASLVLGSLLREVFRESDVVTYDSLSDRYVILLPESGKASAYQAVERLDAIVFQRTQMHLCAGIAEFPSDGLILEDLVERARRAWFDCPVSDSPEDSDALPVRSGAEPLARSGTAMSLPDKL